MRRTRMVLGAGAAVLAFASAMAPTPVGEPAIWTDRDSYVVEAGEAGWRADIPAGGSARLTIPHRSRGAADC